jgi:hypothetical protein
MLTTDQKEIISSICLSLIEGYKIWMACLLSIFVPQYCEETGTTCSLSDNFSNLNDYNKFVLAFNFFTLACFKFSFYLQNKREHYIITHLDVDLSKGDNTLEENIKNYVSILKRVQDHNKNTFQAIQFTTLLFIMNSIFSGVLVIYYYYDGFRTITTLIANILLVVTKLYSYYSITNECMKEKTLALSAFRSSPVSYNVIDPDYTNNIEITKIS